MFKELAKGVYLEGLAADADSIWISDPIRGGIRHLRADGSVKEWLPERKWVGSILFNNESSVLFAGEFGISWLDSETGETGYLIDNVEGAPLPGVNEMVVDSKGGIYFGTLDVPAIATGGIPGPATLYRLDASGAVMKLVSGLSFCNGVGISPDGSKFYFNETFVGTWAFDILADGMLTNRVFLLDKPDCDGIAVDIEGTIWISGYQSSAIIGLRPDGSEKARIETPAGGVSNIWFGGADQRKLYLTGNSHEAGESIRAGNMPDSETASLFCTTVEVPGMKIPPAGFSR